MFKVEEVLTLGKEVESDSLVIEECKVYEPRLDGYYVCLPKDSMEYVKSYIGTLVNSEFILKTYENNPAMGLQLLLKLAKLESYTAEFIKYYGSVDGIYASFAAVSDDAGDAMQCFGSDNTENIVSESQDRPDEDVTESVSELHTESADNSTNEDVFSDRPADYIDEALFNNSVLSDEERSNGDIDEPCMTAGKVTTNDTPSEQMTELLLMLRGVAHKLGVINLEESNILSREDMRMVQRYISGFSPITVMEALKGALAMVETTEDRIAATRFMELFTTYIRENGLKR